MQDSGFSRIRLENLCSSSVLLSSEILKTAPALPSHERFPETGAASRLRPQRADSTRTEKTWGSFDLFHRFKVGLKEVMIRDVTHYCVDFTHITVNRILINK